MNDLPRQEVTKEQILDWAVRHSSELSSTENHLVSFVEACDSYELEGQDCESLTDEIFCLRKYGFKGYIDMDKEELLNEIMQRIEFRDESDEGDDDLDSIIRYRNFSDLLETLELKE